MDPFEGKRRRTVACPDVLCGADRRVTASMRNDCIFEWLPFSITVVRKSV
jgi:hypothetical protein